ncbi:TPA: DUF551 domain-containing protein [Escherichia coli]|nr:DUF551 domain-containing protein [Escherichia coli]EIA0325897.1 DUF551 domain-containing protein [Escherichia coli]EIX1578881.1 DUF551 domain-containing protein [Escherichia coli]ELD3728711.1 DUF551 domain-containing protein [Escherichia coli]ELQ8158474.1 DUF551 domain-containing protein [Escherichia coli]
MAELTKEWLKQTIAEYEANRDELPFGLDTNSAIELQAFKLALASLEAEPVAYIFKHPAGKLFWALTDESNKDQSDVIPVYAASPAPIASETIENAIEYIRSIAFHIDEDDYHGKHIAHYMQQALAWLEGHSCSDDKQGKADNQPASGNQAAESNSGNEWTGNPDIDNAIIMLDRIDTLESCDDNRIEAVKAVLRKLAGNYPVTPDGWISCSERMPAQDDWILIYSKHGEYMAGQVQGEYVELSDGTLSWLGNALYWMPLPEPPQEAK